MADGLTEAEAKDMLLAHQMQVEEMQAANDENQVEIQRKQHREERKRGQARVPSMGAQVIVQESQNAQVRQQYVNAQQREEPSKVTEAEEELAFRPKKEKQGFFASLFGCCSSKSKEVPNKLEKPEKKPYA